MTQQKLQQLKSIVHEILTEDVRTRNSDSLLYLRVLERVAKDTECPVTPFSMTVSYFLQNMKEHGFPPFESVRRARQKAQREFPELKACEAVQIRRLQNEKDFREFARNVKNTQLAIGVRCLDTGEIFASVRDAAKAFGIRPEQIRLVCRGKGATAHGHRFEYISENTSAFTSLCWECANAYGGCSWTGRDETGKVMFQPVEGWDAIETTVSLGGRRTEKSYKVISCPEFLREQKEKSGASG